MKYDSFDGIFIIFAFIVPGFIIYSITSIFTIHKAEEKEILLLKFFTYTCWNYAICSWLIYLIYNSDYFIKSDIHTALAWVLIILFSPIIFGLVNGFASKKEFVRNLLLKLGFKTLHPIPTAWDYVFDDICTNENVWILVTLVDGSRVAGWFGLGSCASTDTSDRDIYVRIQYTIDKNGRWNKVHNSKGILIKSDQIKYIEFTSVEQEETKCQKDH